LSYLKQNDQEKISKMILLTGIVLGIAFNAETVMKSYSQPTPAPTPGSQGVVPQQHLQQPQAQPPSTQAPPSPTPTCNPNSPILQLRSIGTKVTELQGYLVQLGYGSLLGQGGIDGKFGPSTQKAVKNFQEDAGLKPVDGIVGPRTWGVLCEVMTSLAAAPVQQQQQLQQQQFEQNFQGLLKQQQNVQRQIEQIQQQQPQSSQQLQQLQQLQRQLEQLQRQLEQLQQLQSPQAVPAREEGHVPPVTPAQQQQQQQQLQQQQQQLQQVQQQAQQLFQPLAQKTPQPSPPQQQSPTATTTPQMKFKVKIDSIKIHSDHDPFASGEWRLYLDSNGQRVKVDTPGGAMWDVDNGETVTFPNLFVDLSIPTNGVIFIDTLGQEVDGQETKIPPIPSSVKIAFAVGAVAVSGNPLAATYTGYLDQARSVLQKIVALDKNDALGTLSKEYRQAENYGIGTHAERSSSGDYTLTYTISRTQ
jgi:peptidoglycan hydrolase-like protein with peptidoglycan-binding domain